MTIKKREKTKGTYSNLSYQRQRWDDFKLGIEQVKQAVNNTEVIRNDYQIGPMMLMT